MERTPCVSPRSAAATVAARISARVMTQRTEPRIEGKPADRGRYRDYLRLIVERVADYGNQYQELHPSWEYAGTVRHTVTLSP